MNELDHASLEASKKLVDSGLLVREIKFGDCVHHITGKEGIVVQFDPLPVVYCEDGTGFRCDPRTLTILYGFTEVWWELPESITKGGTIQYLEMGKTGSKTYAVYDFADEYVLFDNPTDALIELKIWLKGLGNE